MAYHLTSHTNAFSNHCFFEVHQFDQYPQDLNHNLLLLLILLQSNFVEHLLTNPYNHYELLQAHDFPQRPPHYQLVTPLIYHFA